MSSLSSIICSSISAFINRLANQFPRFFLLPHLLGKLPIIELNGEVIPDSDFIIAKLKQTVFTSLPIYILCIYIYIQIDLFCPLIYDPYIYILYSRIQFGDPDAQLSPEQKAISVLAQRTAEDHLNRYIQSTNQSINQYSINYLFVSTIY